jgi:putative spermidine/putrescine transport system substrate-binding protein
LTDFFDQADFPGRRALKRGAKFNLEMALLADGVPPGNVYRTLDTDAGLQRAFARLDTIKDALVWTNTTAEIIDMVKSGQAAFGMVLNGDVYDAYRRGFTPGMIWDRQLYELDVFGIPAGTPKKKRAMDFIRYATGSAPLAAMASWVPYGPARRSAQGLIGVNPELHINMQRWLPTTPANFATAFAIDDEWWRANEARIDARWQAWLDSGQPAH